jgi:23S rRNA (guanosine2251-2'-O)-methyltransferase
MNNSENYIYGRNAVTEAINSGKKIEKIYISFGLDDRFTKGLIISCKKNGIPFIIYDKKKFIDYEKKNLPDVAKTQGVIALMRSFDILELDEFLETLNLKENPIVLILDEISDPQNLGAIARSAECAGAKGIILPERNSAPISPIAIKTSAGALEYIPIIRVSNLNNTISDLKEFGFWIYGTDMDGTHNYTANIYNSPVALIIGSEGKGMRPSIRKNCDFILNINMKGKINSLNASVSAGIVLFEILRQRDSVAK